MRWQVNHIRPFLIALALSIGAALAFYLVWVEPPAQTGCPIAGALSTSNFITWVNLTFKDFHPAGNQFTGSVEIEVAPRQYFEMMHLRAINLKQVVLRFGHFYESNKNMYQGGGDNPIVLAFQPPRWGSLRGKGTFSWTGNTQNGPFYYPFDKYVLKVNPELIQESRSNRFQIIHIDTLLTDFGNSNFIPHVENLHANDQHDPYQITLQRPLLLRALAIIVGILLFTWLIYLIWYAKPEEYAGHIVTLFVGVFSIRNSLLSGAPSFPSLIDYCALGVYLSAALIVLIKWFCPNSDKKNKECPFCKSTIPLAATYCPQCTQAVEVEVI